jgi:GR25 family glycosyltransferase involved in LPS biosynthesis
MKAFVITLINEPRSVEVADRCVASAAGFGIEVEKLRALTPADKPLRLAEQVGVDLTKFHNNPYSRLEPCVATFMSHHALWARCSVGDEPFLVLEHDAVFIEQLPDRIEDRIVGICNLGRPSFGAFKTPDDGLHPFVSKPGGYLGGAHAYLIKPAAAADMVRKSFTEAEPTDVFINVHRFPALQEYYPWPVVCDDAFSTIQKPRGCQAKHNRVEPI